MRAVFDAEVGEHEQSREEPAAEYRSRNHGRGDLSGDNGRYSSRNSKIVSHL